MANPSTSIDPAQPFVPVILGGDIGTYTLAREFHEAYGVRSVVMPAAGNGVIEHSVAIELRPIGSMADEARVTQALRELAEELAGEGERPLLLFGSLDYHVMLIARHREELSAHYVIPYPELEVIEQAALKENFYALAERLGVPHPRTRVYRPGNAVATVVEGLNFPLIGKPSSSGDWIAAKFAGKQKIHTLKDFQQLTDLLSRIDASGYDSATSCRSTFPAGMTPCACAPTSPLSRTRAPRSSLPGTGKW
ncbi:hypothetical protein [Arthrobacter sp. JCM 19049]|uniref:hypothetical protein n=1 Tax=Arthrobacter sp. JCM 19049 TaxID=1460643 RepID=UPI0006D25CB7|nr:hypothetical protein [Arthrobacter sp. JCM 19049]